MVTSRVVVFLAVSWETQLSKDKGTPFWCFKDSFYFKSAFCKPAWDWRGEGGMISRFVCSRSSRVCLYQRNIMSEHVGSMIHVVSWRPCLCPHSCMYYLHVLMFSRESLYTGWRWAYGSKLWLHFACLCPERLHPKLNCLIGPQPSQSPSILYTLSMMVKTLVMSSPVLGEKSIGRLWCKS